MVVATSAANASAQKRLSDGIGQLRLFNLAVFPNDGDKITYFRMIAHITRGRQNFPRHAVPARAVGEPTPQPSMKRPHPFDTPDIMVPLPAVLQHISELQCPIIKPFRRIEQVVDESRALTRRGIDGEGGHLFRSRKDTDGIEKSPAHKFRVAAVLRGRKS